MIRRASEDQRMIVPEESPLVFQPTLACLFGMGKAALIQQIQYWITRPKRGESMYDGYYDGKWWVYHTYETWRTHAGLIFLAEGTIKRYISELENDGVIISIQPEQFNRRKWYRLNYDRLNALIDAYEAGQELHSEPEPDMPIGANCSHGSEQFTNSMICADRSVRNHAVDLHETTQRLHDSGRQKNEFFPDEPVGSDEPDKRANLDFPSGHHQASFVAADDDELFPAYIRTRPIEPENTPARARESRTTPGAAPGQATPDAPAEAPERPAEAREPANPPPDRRALTTRLMEAYTESVAGRGWRMNKAGAKDHLKTLIDAGCRPEDVENVIAWATEGHARRKAYHLSHLADDYRSWRAQQDRPTVPAYPSDPTGDRTDPTGGAPPPDDEYWERLRAICPGAGPDIF